MTRRQKPTEAKRRAFGPPRKRRQRNRTNELLRDDTATLCRIRNTEKVTNVLEKETRNLSGVRLKIECKLTPPALASPPPHPYLHFSSHLTERRGNPSSRAPTEEQGLVGVVLLASRASRSACFPERWKGYRGSSKPRRQAHRKRGELRERDAGNRPPQV